MYSGLEEPSLVCKCDCDVDGDGDDDDGDDCVIWLWLLERLVLKEVLCLDDLDEVPSRLERNMSADRSVIEAHR